MFNEIETGGNVVTPTTDESIEQSTISTEIDSNVDDTNQYDEQGNISDTTSSEEKTVPFDVVESIRQELKDAKDRENKLLNLVLKGQLNQQQAKEPEPEKDIFGNIDDDSVLFGKDVKNILNQFKESLNADRAKETQSVRELQLIQHEQTFRESNPDYDDIIGVLPQNVIQSLYSTYNDPAELVNIAYRMGKALKGENPNTSNQSTLKQKVNVENKINQNLQKPKSISQAKGKTDVEPPISANDFYNQRFGR